MHRKMLVSGFIRGRDKYTDAQVAALIEELDLIPAFLITPTLVKMYRQELRDKATTARGYKDTINEAIAFTENFLQSDKGIERTEHFNSLFSFVPDNR